MPRLFARFSFAAMIFSPSLVLAHPGPHHSNSLAEGLLHPFTGIDHIAAMLAAGIWAAQLGGRAMRLLPFVFALAMALGGLLGLGGFEIPWLEGGLAASVLVLGVLVAAAARLPLVPGALLIGSFALLHGFAHGTEMPLHASRGSWSVGFLLSTILLLAGGLLLGSRATGTLGTRALRFAGALITACGLHLALA